MVERGIPMIEKILADEMGSSIKVNFVNGGGDTQSKSKSNKKSKKTIKKMNKIQSFQKHAKKIMSQNIQVY